ncbi:hypothetical protein [Mycobacterium seoulense]|uniref:hypothetical protein n=1 Tax=Mycobacterium seoulense TaxID=386911 RepID=UPI003CF6FDCC
MRETTGSCPDGATLLARLDEIADAVADGDLTPPQAKRATERVNEKLADIDRRQQDQERLRVFDGLPLGKPEVAEAIEKLSADRLRADACWTRWPACRALSRR